MREIGLPEVLAQALLCPRRMVFVVAALAVDPEALVINQFSGEPSDRFSLRCGPPA